MKRRIISLLLIIISFTLLAQSKQQPDSNKLGRALDYFAGRKYHEALVILVKLDESHKLSPRFKAYIGVCYYHEQDYKMVCQYLDQALPFLDAYSPTERNVYYHITAESHFMLNEYNKAIPLYEKQLMVCHDNEKGDVFYRLGFCYMFMEKWENAICYFNSALAYYDKFSKVVNNARITQLKKMIKGCEKNK